MKRCIRCHMPDTRPGAVFQGDVCQACINYENRQNVNWDDRSAQLDKICEDAKSAGADYDCVIAVSGGKDSYFICDRIINKRGMKALLITVTDEFTHTEAGKHNLDNLIKTFGCDHIMVRMNPQEFVAFTRADTEEELHPLKWIEEHIYNQPIKIATEKKIPIVFFGENSAYEYGTTDTDSPICDKNDKTTTYFMSYFYPWSSPSNLIVAKNYGFKDLNDTGEWPREGMIEQYEQIDSVAYLLQLWTKYPKYGFQRVSDVASRRVRDGSITLEEAKALIDEKDSTLDPMALQDFLNTCGYTEEEFWEIVNKHKKYG